MKWSVKLVVFVLLILLGLGLGYYYWHRPKVTADQIRFLATWGLADYLARTFPGSRALVISNPYISKKKVASYVIEQEKSGLEGLRAGFGDKVTLADVVYPELKPEAESDPRSVPMDAGVTTPLSYLVTDRAFDQLVEQHPNCDLVVSLIGMPANLDQVKCWTQKGSPKFALLLPDLDVMGGVAAVEQALESGKLTAFVELKAGFSQEGTISSAELKSEFEKRFLLVTPDNFNSIVQTEPELLGLEAPKRR
jgi:hypothetical protein